MICTSCVLPYSAKASLVATAEAAPQLNWQTILALIAAPSRCCLLCWWPGCVFPWRQFVGHIATGPL
jgi:hypothetical protein